MGDVLIKAATSQYDHMHVIGVEDGKMVWQIKPCILYSIQPMITWPDIPEGDNDLCYSAAYSKSSR